MAMLPALLLLCSFCMVQPYKLIGLEDLDTFEDTATVESTVREVRAAPPFDLEHAATHYHTKHDDEGKAELGYSRKKSDQGKKGYQHFDSFHKKAGDNYAFEKHDSFGLDDKQGDEETGAHSAKLQKADKYQHAPEAESSHYEVSEGGDSDGDHDSESDYGGPSGHDEADSKNYELPAGYTYGAGEEYDF